MTTIQIELLTRKSHAAIDKLEDLGFEREQENNNRFWAKEAESWDDEADINHTIRSYCKGEHGVDWTTEFQTAGEPTAKEKAIADIHRLMAEHGIEFKEL